MTDPKAEGMMQTIESSVWDDEDRRLPVHYAGGNLILREWLRVLRGTKESDNHPVGRCEDRMCACQPRVKLEK